VQTELLCFLIDDDPDDQEIFCMALDELNPAIKRVMASNGEDGIKKLSLNPLVPPDYIFLDLNMPRMNGIECLKEIKKVNHLQKTKVIMYSNTDAHDVRELTKVLGADDFIVKPPSFLKLVEFLSAVLNIKTLTNRLTKGE
jgi:DNA-binding response OmpR family regulator